MDITYRPAAQEDLEPALRIVQEAYNDLRVRHGLTASVGLRPPLFQRFCLAEDPDGFWIAETSGAPVGFGFAWMRQGFWYLAQLFVRPGTQARGVGQALLSRTLRLTERKGGAENRALITMAYNTASTGLYIHNGLYPREPLLRMAAPASVLEGRIAPAGLEVMPIEPWPVSREWLGRIDEEVLGFRREEHHAFLLGGFAARALRIERGGQPAGYAYISAEGHIGPLAVAPGANPAEVVAAAIRCALEGRPNQVSMIVPGKAGEMLATVSELGFRIDEPFVLLSARPFGDWRRYLPSNPGFM
jgi:GNAT superfamily N-acetyltransferase